MSSDAEYGRGSCKDNFADPGVSRGSRIIPVSDEDRGELDGCPWLVEEVEEEEEVAVLGICILV